MMPEKSRSELYKKKSITKSSRSVESMLSSKRQNSTSYIQWVKMTSSKKHSSKQDQRDSTMNKVQIKKKMQLQHLRHLKKKSRAEDHRPDPKSLCQTAVEPLLFLYLKNLVQLLVNLLTLPKLINLNRAWPSSEVKLVNNQLLQKGKSELVASQILAHRLSPSDFDSLINIITYG